MIRNTINYVFIFILMFLYTNCSDRSQKTSTKEIIKVHLGFKNKEKEIILNLPFGINEIKIVDFRCTGNEAFCKTYKNDILQIEVCHKYLDSSNLFKSEDNLDNNIRQSYVNRIKSESRRYRGKTSHELFQIITEKSNNYKFTKSGFGLTWERNNMFLMNYSWLSQKEYLNIEFSQVSKSKLDKNYLVNEINYIINTLKGIPEHNTG